MLTCGTTAQVVSLLGMLEFSTTAQVVSLLGMLEFTHSSSLRNEDHNNEQQEHAE
jgi:hypothetical protein